MLGNLMSAVEARNITKKIRAEKLEKQIKGYARQIEDAASRGEFYVSCDIPSRHQLQTENRIGKSAGKWKATRKCRNNQSNILQNGTVLMHCPIFCSLR